MTDNNDHTRQRIISSVFDKRNAGSTVQESYVAHIKIWEDADDGQGKKPRYILLSSASTATSPVLILLMHTRSHRRYWFPSQVQVEHKWFVFGRQDVEARRIARY